MSKQRNLRKSKLSFVDEDEEEDDPADGHSISSVAAIRAAQKQKLKQKKAEKNLSLLSFDDDDGDGKRHHRAGGGGILAAPPPPTTTTTLHTSNAAAPRASTYYTQVSESGEYTAERLKQMQKATRRAPPSTVVLEDAGTADIQQNMEIEVEEEGDDDEDEDRLIPSAADIKAAKERRELQRVGGNAATPDYIPLSMGNTTTMGLPGSNVEAAVAARRNLMQKNTFKGKVAGDVGDREEGSDADVEPEELLRIHFDATGGGVSGGAPVGGVGQKKNKKSVVFDVSDGMEEEDEEAAWAEEQIKKGIRAGGGGVDTLSALAKAKNNNKENENKAMIGFLPPSQTAAAVAAAEEAMAALRAASERARVSQRQAEKNLKKTDRSLTECIEAIARMEGEMKSAGDKYVYIQELRAYITDLCTMLAEKSPLIEELQEELQRVREERSAAHFRRCAAVERERRAPVEVAIAAATEALLESDIEAAAAAAANRAAEEKIQELSAGGHIPVVLDDMGRDINAHRRSKVKQRLSLLHREEEQQEDESMLTTSESEDDVEEYTKNKQQVLDTAADAFKNASDEFASLEAVASRLEEWKRRYPAQYFDVFMPESVPALFAPFVRLELLSWCPVFDCCEGKMDENVHASEYSGFDQQSWYQILFTYGGMHDKEEDEHLIPKLVRGLLLPIVSATITRVWNPLSSRQSGAVAEMVMELALYSEHDTSGADPGPSWMVDIIQACRKKLEGIVYAVRMPSSWSEAAVKAAAPWGERYLDRMFGRSLRLLKSVCAFRHVMGVDEWVVKGVMDRLVLPYLRRVGWGGGGG